MPTAKHESQEDKEFEEALEKELLLGIQLKEEMNQMVSDAFSEVVGKPMQLQLTTFQSIIEKMESSAVLYSTTMSRTVNTIDQGLEGQKLLLGVARAATEGIGSANAQLGKQVELLGQAIVAINSRIKVIEQRELTTSNLVAQLEAASQRIFEQAITISEASTELKQNDVPGLLNSAESVNQSAAAMKELLTSIDGVHERIAKTIETKMISINRISEAIAQGGKDSMKTARLWPRLTFIIASIILVFQVYSILR